MLDGFGLNPNLDDFFEDGELEDIISMEEEYEETEEEVMVDIIDETNEEIIEEEGPDWAQI